MSEWLALANKRRRQIRNIAGILGTMNAAEPKMVCNVINRFTFGTSNP